MPMFVHKSTFFSILDRNNVENLIYRCKCFYISVLIYKWCMWSNYMLQQ